MNAISKQEGNDRFLKSLRKEVEFWEAEMNRIQAVLLDKGLLKNRRIERKIEWMAELLDQIRSNEKEIEGSEGEHWENISRDMAIKYHDLITSYQKEIASGSAKEAAVLQLKRKDETRLYMEILKVINEQRIKRDFAIQSLKSLIRIYRQQILLNYRSLLSMSEKRDAFVANSFQF